MKVSIARIRMYLKVGKTLSDGSHPIMLMCSYNGRKEVSTGYSCTEKYWDKKSEMIKKGYPNFIQINQHLKKLKDEAISRRDSYIASGSVYTPQMILCREEVRNAVTNYFKGLIQRYIDEKGLSKKSEQKWNIIKENVIEFCGNDKLIINEVNESFCRRYGKWLEKKGMASGSIKSYLSKVAALLHYAVGLGLIDKYPLSGWKYYETYRESKSELYIHHRSMEVMMQMFLDSVIERNGGMWSYKDGVIEKLMDIHSELYCHYLYCLGYYFKGLSPCDLSMLKKSDIKVIQIGGINSYAIDGQREKTHMPFKIRLRVNCVESQVLVQTMLMFNTSGEYFLPTLNGFNGDKNARVNNLYVYHTKRHLIDWFQRVNEEIARRNVVDGDNIPLIDLGCRFYSYRHSYIMSEIQKPSCNILALAQSVGKSSHTLHQYISLLGDIDLL